MSLLQGTEQQERAWVGLLWPLKGQKPGSRRYMQQMEAWEYSPHHKEIQRDGCVPPVPEGDLTSDESTSQMPWEWI